MADVFDPEGSAADARTLAAWNAAVERWEVVGSVIRSIAAREVGAGRHFTFQFIMEELRRRPHIGRDGVEIAINNSLAPAYARLLLRDYPACRPYLETRRSRFDRFVKSGLDG